MAVRDAFKISRKTFFNPTAWFGVDTLKTQHNVIWRILKGLFTAPKPEREETFEEAMVRLNLTEEDIKSALVSYRYYTLIFAVLGFVMFAYSFYLLFRYGTFLGWLLGLAVTVLFFSQAFKYDFWVFQIKRRKLGATFAEWKRNFLGEKEAPPK
jgi:intracellular multiplication protein IcmV